MDEEHHDIMDGNLVEVAPGTWVGHSNYVVIRDGVVVQEIRAAGANNALEQKTEEGNLFVRCGV